MVCFRKNPPKLCTAESPVNNTNVESRLIYFPNFMTIYTYLFPGFLTYIIQINDDITQRIYLLLLPK
jgi:hypothetical protein